MEHIGSCNPWAVAWDLVTLRPIQKGGCPRFFLIFKGNLLGEPHGFSATNTPQTPPLDVLRTAIHALDAWYLDYVASLGQAEGEAVLSFHFVDGDRGQMSREEMLLHLVTHGGYHRGAIGRILVQCGITPPRDTLTTFLHRSEPGRRGG
ncbi:DinB family protein [Aeromonas caviae]|uniref:DinB family protein n=1 Tax=Aeromonas caviae TaxID=648 RepID=UPI003977B524